METHVQTLARAQAELGAEVSVVCVNHEDRRGDDVTWDPLAATPTVKTRDEGVLLVRLGRRASLARFDVCPDLVAWMDQVRSEGIDLFHLHVPNPTMLLALAVKRPRLPLVISYHSDIVRQRFLAHAFRPIERLVFARAARILSDSPTYAEGSAFLGSYLHKLAVLPMGIDLGPYLRPSPKALAIARGLQREHGSPLWLAVGRLVYYKGLPNAIQALRFVSGKLIVIGTGPLEEELRHLSRQCGVENRIVWLGYRSFEEVVGAYHAATALWFPSNARSEGFGLVQVEAMASGCPVINCALPGTGVPWVSRHEETGLTVRVDDPGELARAARRLLSEPWLRQRLAAGARKRAREEFDQRLMAERSLSFYRAILHKEPVEDARPLRKSA